MIASIGRVVARCTRPGNRGKTRQIIQPGHASDYNGQSVKERLTPRYGLARSSSSICAS